MATRTSGLIAGDTLPAFDASTPDRMAGSAVRE
jgi:hypothetical protein